MAAEQPCLPRIAPTVFQVTVVMMVYLFTVPALLFLSNPSGRLAAQLYTANFYVTLAVVLGASFGVLWAVRAARSSWPLYVLIGVFFVARIVWYASVTPEPVSDFLEYWERAQEFASGALELPARGVHQCRAVPYFLPIAYVLGSSLMAVAVVNSAAIAAVSLIAYRLTSRIYAPPVAAACVVLANMAPEMFGAAAIPSHDIPGLLYLAALFLILDVTWMIFAGRMRGLHLAVVAVLAAIASVAIFLNDLQRYPETLVFVVLISWLAVVALQFLPAREKETSKRRSPFWLLVGFVAVVVVCSALLASSTWLRTACFSPKQTLENFISYSHSMTLGTYGYKQAGVRPMLRRVGTTGRKDVLGALVLSDLADNPAARWEAVTLKARRLFAFGSQGTFYLFQWSKLRKESPIFDRYVRADRAYATLLNLMLVAAPFGFWWLYRKGKIAFSPVAYLPFVTIAVLIFFLLMTGETQPRYLLPIYFFASLVFGAVFACAAPTAAGRTEPIMRQEMSPLFFVSLAGLLAAPLCLYLLSAQLADRWLGVANGRLINLEAAVATRNAAPLPALSEFTRKERPTWSLRKVSPVFGNYAQWIWATEPGAHVIDSRQCGFPARTQFEARGLAGALQIRGSRKPTFATEPGSCVVKVADQRRDCTGSRQFKLAPVTSDDDGCIAFSHHVSTSDGEPPLASWLALLRFHRLPD
jgi:hypothetical protein